MDQTPMPKEFSAEQLHALATSPAAQQLLRIMQEKDSGALQNAAQHALRGNHEIARQSIASLLEDPEIRSLLSRLGGF